MALIYQSDVNYDADMYDDDFYIFGGSDSYETISHGATYYTFGFPGSFHQCAKGTLFGDDDYYIYIYRKNSSGSWTTLVNGVHIAENICETFDFTSIPSDCRHPDFWKLKIYIAIPGDGHQQASLRNSPYYYPHPSGEDMFLWLQDKKIRKVQSFNASYSSSEISVSSYMSGTITQGYGAWTYVD